MTGTSAAANDPKSDMCCWQISWLAETTRAAGFSGRMPPAATSDDAVLALVRTMRIFQLWLWSPVARIVEIPAPFGHVASHVMKAESVGLKTANTCGVGFAAHQSWYSSFTLTFVILDKVGSMVVGLLMGDLIAPGKTFVR